MPVILSATKNLLDFDNGIFSPFSGRVCTGFMVRTETCAHPTTPIRHGKVAPPDAPSGGDHQSRQV